MVSIGLVIERGSDYVYAINTIMAQSYDSLEIICSIDEGIDISIYDVLDCIRIHRKDNVKRVYVICGKKQKSFEEHIRCIIKACQGEYVFFISSKDAFIDVNVIRNFVEKSEPTKVVMLGITARYKNNEYVGNGEYSDIIMDKQSIKVLSSYIREGAPLLIQKKYIEELGNNNVCNALESVIQKAEVPSLRHDDESTELKGTIFNIGNYESDGYLNYTNSVYLQALVKRIIQRNIKRSEVTEEIEAAEKYIIGKSAGGHWGVTDSDKKMLFFLYQIGEINKQIVMRRSNLVKKLKEIQKCTRNKIHILMLTQEFHLWPSFKSVYDEAQKDERFSVDLVYIPFEHPQKRILPEEEIARYRKAGYFIKEYNEYKLNEVSPDVVIIMKPYDNIPKEFLFSNIDKVIRRNIYIRYAPSVNFVMNERLIELLFTLPAYFLMWKCLAYTREELETAKQYSFQKGDEWLAIGHPRDDLAYENLNEEEKKYYNSLKELAKGRKLFLWNTAAQMKKEADIIPYGSFLERGQEIIDYFKSNTDAFLVWRPHPLFFQALAEIWGAEKTAMFIKKIREIENIYIDEYKQYTPAMLLSDAFISDTSSLVDLYIPSMRPILLTKRSEVNLDNYNKDFLDAISIMESKSSIEDFASMVMREDNNRKTKQQEYVYNNYFSKRYEKKVSENLLEEIVCGITKEEKKLFIERQDKEGELLYDRI